MKSIGILEKASKISIMFYIVSICVLIFIPFTIGHQYFMHVMIMIFVYAIAGEAWNILGGYTGQISLGNAMFFGIGAYTSSILWSYYNINPWIGAILGGIIAISWGIIIGFPTFRLVGKYFVIATLAAGEIMLIIFTNWEFVKGAKGLDLPLMEDSIKYMTFLYNKNGFYFITLIILVLFLLLVVFITNSKLGYYLHVIKEEEDAARSIGINTTLYKSVAISITAFFTAIAGTIYAQYILYIDPKMVFHNSMSIKFLLIASLGGTGHVMGPVLGSIILVPIIEFSRVLFGGAGQGFDMLVYGIMIIFIALIRPEGLITIFKLEKK